MAAKKSKKERMKEAAQQKPMPVKPEVEKKEEAPAPAVVSAPRKTVCEALSKKDIVMTVLYALLMFVAMTVQTGKMTIVLMVLAAALSIGRKPLENLRAHLSLPMLGLIAFALMGGVASLHSRFGSVAAAELYKLMAAFSLVWILLVRFEKKHVRGLLWGFSAVCAVIALVCVDMGSWGKLFEAFNAYVKMMGGDFSDILVNSQGGRVNGIYNDANLTGALLGMALLVQVYLAHTAEKLSGRFWALMALGVSAVSFFMAMSRGAMVCFAVAVLVYLAVEQGKTRTKLFFLLLTAGLTGAVAGALALMKMEVGSLLPVLLALLAGPAAFAMDWAVMGRLAKLLEGRGKLVAAVCGGLVIVLACGVFAAFQITEPYDFAEGAWLTRGLKLEPGEYTVSGDWTGEDDVQLRVSCRTKDEILMKQRTIAYNGPLQDASFVVEEDTVWVRLRLRGSEGTVLNEMVLSDGTKIPLKYSLLPESIVSRLQDGLLQGHSFQQRLQYVRDGLKLFKQSPLIGHGYGASEYLLLTVQPYFYESVFIHNHIVQVMDEMGAVGLAAFLLLLLGSLFVLLRLRKEERDPLAAALIACWAMMNLHSFMEINFSVRMFQCAAFFILMIPVLCFAKPMLKKWSKPAGYVVLAVVCLDLAIFGSLLRGHRKVAEEAGRLQTTNATAFMNALQGFAERAPFDKTAHQLNFVANALALGDSEYTDTMHQYVEDLHETGTYAAYSGLAQHYYLTLNDWQNVFECSRLAIGQFSSDSTAWNAQLDFYRNTVLPAMPVSDMDVFVEGIADLESYLARYSEGRMEEITFTEENQTFLQKVTELTEAGCTEQELYAALTALNAELTAEKK